MHRISIVLAACLLYAPHAHADRGGAKRLSVQVTTGIKPDMANLGSTISQDGTLDTADSTMAALVYRTGQAFMSDRNNQLLYHNSQQTDSSFRFLGEEPETGGPMLGADFGASVQYELDDVLGLPLYLKGGFHYTTRFAGGHQRRVLGDAAAANPNIANLLLANGEDPADYIGGVMETQFDASWIEVPITVGIKLPFSKDNYSFAYGGVGLSFFRGGFSVAFTTDENYSNVLATHVNTQTLTVTNLSPGAIDEKVDFILGGMGLNWSLGVQTRIGSSPAALFVELNTSGAAKTVYSSDLKPETRRIMTALSSQTLYNEDSEWFKRLSFPVVTGGAAVRVGLRYYLF